MTALKHTFETHSKEIVQRFLHSLIVLDDEVSYDPFGQHGARSENGSGTKLTRPPGPRSASRMVNGTAGGSNGCSKPVESATSSNAGEEEGAVTLVEGRNTNSRLGSHGLDAKALADSCAELGLICGILKPDTTQKTTSRVIKAAQRADVVVLDWVIHADDGELTCQLIERIVTGESERLRLIVIYTGEKDSEKILEKIVGTSKQWSPDRDASYARKRGPTRLTLAFKAGTKVLEHLRERVVSEHDLPNLLIRDFTHMTMGLLSNVALEAVAAIRSNTHHLLHKFAPRMDAPYLTHRGLSTPPDEAEGHLVPMITAEVQAILNGLLLEKHLDLELLRLWYTHRLPNGLNAGRNGSGGDQLPTEQWWDLMKTGEPHRKGDKTTHRQILRLSLDELTSVHGEWDGHSTSTFGKDQHWSSIADEDFAILTSIESRYENEVPPRLSLGVIVALNSISTDGNEAESPDYFICLQPRCDSTRIEVKGRRFLFAPMEVASEHGKFDLVLRVSDERVRLKYRPIRTYELRFFRFVPSKSYPGRVCAKRGAHNQWCFETQGAEIRVLRWVCELRPNKAQQLAHELGHQFSRIGLTESEWLRRRSRKDGKSKIGRSS